MKKLLVLASAVSLVALASGANAQTTAPGAQLTLTGVLNPLVGIDLTATVNTTPGAGSGTITDNGSGTSRSINLSNFQNTTTNATTHFNGTTSFSVKSNTVFVASLYSQYGTLKSGNNSVSYTIGFDGTTGTPSTSSSAPLIKTYTTPVGGAQTVGITYDVAAGQMGGTGNQALPGGTYSDVITFGVAAQ